MLPVKAADHSQTGCVRQGDGWSTIKIAEKFGITTNTVNRSLFRAGVKLRTSYEGLWDMKIVGANGICRWVEVWSGWRQGCAWSIREGERNNEV